MHLFIQCDPVIIHHFSFANHIFDVVLERKVIFNIFLVWIHVKINEIGYDFMSSSINIPICNNWIALIYECYMSYYELIKNLKVASLRITKFKSLFPCQVYVCFSLEQNSFSQESIVSETTYLSTFDI